jgi:DNA-binding response OmpR family regulator
MNRKRLSKEDLTKQELRLMAVFEQHAGVILTQRNLLELAWEGKYLAAGVKTRTVDTYVARLRQKIKAGRIETVFNHGYRWAPAISTPAVQSANANE